MGGDDWTGVCASGHRQSPIAVQWDKVLVDTHAPLNFNTHYSSTVGTIRNAGYAHVVQGYFGSVQLEYVVFDATMIVLRTPAEHRIQEVPRSPLEVQIIHQRRHGDRGDNTQLKGETLILSVMVDEGEPESSPSLSNILSQTFPMNSSESVAVQNVDLNDVVDDMNPVLLYEGSLTVPPCTEGILWGVLMGENKKISAAKIAHLDSLYRKNYSFAKGRGNNRNIQKLGDRSLTLRTNCGKGTGRPCQRSIAAEDANADE